MARSQNGNRRAEMGTPPSPRSIGMMELGEICEVILVLQQVRGKILETKHLRGLFVAFIMVLLLRSQDERFAFSKSRSFEHSRAVENLQPQWKRRMMKSP